MNRSGTQRFGLGERLNLLCSVPTPVRYVTEAGELPPKSCWIIHWCREAQMKKKVSAKVSALPANTRLASFSVVFISSISILASLINYSNKEKHILTQSIILIYMLNNN